MVSEAELLGEAFTAAHGTGADDAGARTLVAALFAARRGDVGNEAESAVRAAAEQIGTAAGEAGETGGAVVRRILSTGETLARRGAEMGVVLPQEAVCIRRLAEAAAESAVDAWEAAQSARREAWLSRLTHDVKGRLNVVSLNLWLIRQAAPAQADKFDKIDRAMARTLDLLRDVRELHERARHPVPPTGSALSPSR